MRRYWSVVVSSLLLVLGVACGGDSSSQPDAMPDTPIDPCAQCTADEMCVQSFGGTCQSLGVRCVSPTVGSVDCRQAACDPACERTYCNQPLQCQTAPPCPGESAKAFRCYGP